MRDKRTPKDVCGEAIILHGEQKANKGSLNSVCCSNDVRIKKARCWEMKINLELLICPSFS